MPRGSGRSRYLILEQGHHRLTPPRQRAPQPLPACGRAPRLRGTRRCPNLETTMASSSDKMNKRAAPRSSCRKQSGRSGKNRGGRPLREVLAEVLQEVDENDVTNMRRVANKLV